MKEKSIVAEESIVNIIIVLRGHKVILDTDLAKLYGVPTKVLNQALKRNIDRFPQDFVFQLIPQEKNELVTNCDQFRNLKYSSTLPFAFTEHGALMASTVLNSNRAVEMSLAIIRTFIKLRNILMEHKDLQKKLEALEKKYNENFLVVFKAIKKLMEPPKPELESKKHKGQFGFNTK